MNWLVGIIKAVSDIPNTLWGVLILGASMYISVKYNHDVGMYFSGVGSTLLGINHIKGNSNASDTTGKN